MKQKVLVLTVLLLPSLAFAQSRGDMLPFQGPTGAMAGITQTHQTKVSDRNQAALYKVLENLSEEGASFKTAIDNFKSHVNTYLVRTDNNSVETVNDVVVELNALTANFEGYLSAQQVRLNVLKGAAAQPECNTTSCFVAESLSWYYISERVNSAMANRRLERAEKAMQNERIALMKYLNELDGGTLSDYLNMNLVNCSFDEEMLQQATKWQTELAAAATAPLL